MPRLSVDVDLAYVSMEDRAVSLANISAALERIKSRVETIIPNARAAHRRDAGKLQISAQGVNVKLEVNLVARGTLAAPVKMPLCAKAQKEFEAFCAVQIVPFGQLYGGKIAAALDRQHPRDLFDVKYLLANEGYSDEVKRGVIYSLLCSDRPIHEVLSPNFQDQRPAMTNQFAGMSDHPFSYAEFESVRKELAAIVLRNLTDKDGVAVSGSMATVHNCASPSASYFLGALRAANSSIDRSRGRVGKRRNSVGCRAD
jgi:predicted nucleotidyltransferase component of viral defense system